VMMVIRNSFLAGLVVCGFIAALCGCSDLDKYQKPADQQTQASEKPAPELKSIDVRGTKAEQEKGREFKIRLDRIRAEFAQSQDTIAAIAGLDSLLFSCNKERLALSPDSEFGTFYMLMMADILDQVATLRRGIGDVEGAREAQAKLAEIRKALPY
jgi:hypothetical protein